MKSLTTILTKEEISSYFLTKEYPASSVIFSEGNHCEGLSFVISGQVLIVTQTYNEKEEIINVINEMEVFGDILCFSTNPVYLGTGIAKKKTKILYLTTNNFYSLAKTNQAFLKYVLNIISDKTLIIKNETKLLCHKNIKDRLIYYLSFLSKKTNNKTIRIESVEKLANELSLPRPSVSRELSRLVRDGLIIKNKNIITLLF